MPIKSNYFISQLIVASALLCVCDSALAIAYFCPRADMGLEGMLKDGSGELNASHGGLVLNWPKASRDLRVTGGDRVVFSVALTDCSSDKFFCAHAEQTYLDEQAVRYFLVVPKVVDPGRTYEFNGVTLKTQLAARFEQFKPPSIQVVSTQEIDGQEVHFSFTLEQGRGIIYWDGFFFEGTRKTEGELCALRYEQGIFSSVILSSSGE